MTGIIFIISTLTTVQWSGYNLHSYFMIDQKPKARRKCTTYPTASESQELHQSRLTPSPVCHPLFHKPSPTTEVTSTLQYTINTQQLYYNHAGLFKLTELNTGGNSVS